MTVLTGERRDCLRVSAAYPATVYDRRGNVLARGRTANISENGVYLLVDAVRNLATLVQVRVELLLPAVSSHTYRRDDRRTVRYVCRVAHTEPIGHLTGIGVEFIRKLP